MSWVNKTRGDNKTFGDIAKSIFMYAIQSGTDSSRADIALNVHKEKSIKTAERKGWGESIGLIHGSIVAGYKIQY